MATPNYDSTVSEIDERLNASRNLRRVQEGRWLINMAMYLDHQWVKVDPSGRVYNVGDDGSTPILQENRIQPAVRSDIAKMTKSNMVWVGVPRNRSDEEISSARLREDVFDHYWQQLQMRRKLRSALMYQRLCSAGFLKVTWDKTAGKSATGVFKGDKALTDGQGMPYRSAQDIPEQLREGIEERQINFGEPCIEIKSSFELLPDALATEEGLISCEYIGEESVYSPHYLQRRFNIDVEGDARASSGTLESRFPGFSGIVDRGRGAAGRMGVKCREYWSLPGIDGPRGKHCLYLAQDNQLVFEEDLPYPWLPYTMIGGLPAGRFWPEAPATIWVSSQVELNKTLSQIAANAERIGNPPRARAADSLTEGQEWHGLPGEELVFEDMGSPNSVPQFLDVPEMPMYVRERTNDLRDAIRFMAGQMEVSSGGVPPGVTAASAINLLIEENDTMLGPDIAEMEDGITDMGRKLLWMLAKYASDERLLRISGENGAWDIKTWRGSQLKDAGADEVQAGSGMPQSKAAKQAAIQQFINLFIQNGQALSPRVLRQVSRDMETGGLEHFFDNVGKTETQVQEEHRRMLEGEGLDRAEEQPVLEPDPNAIDPRTGESLMVQSTTSMGEPLYFGIPVNDYDEDDLHLETHYEFFRSARFTELGRTPQGKMLQNLMLGHAKLHEIKLQQAANQEAAAQMIQEGTDPQGGPPLDPSSLNGGGNVANSAPPV